LQDKAYCVQFLLLFETSTVELLNLSENRKHEAKVAKALMNPDKSSKPSDFHSKLSKFIISYFSSSYNYSYNSERNN